MSYQFNSAQLAWLEALESGEYPQTKGALTKLDGEGNVIGCCCLGVACELAAQGKFEGVSLDFQNDELYCGDPCRAYDDSEKMYAPSQVVEALGLRSERGLLELPAKDRNDSIFALAELNDCADWSFETIAKYIRENPENVFLQ